MPTDITNDPSTWPSGDKIWNICHAIAMAEGYNVPNSNPYRLNNPGDISDGASQFNQEFHSGSQITHFPDALTGWTWLYNKIKNIAEGKSHVFSKSMTWYEFGKHYAPPNWQVWADNVAISLRVSPDSTMEDYLDATQG